MVLLKSISLRLPSRAFGIGFIHQSPKGNSINCDNSFFFGPYFMYGKVSPSEGGTIEAYYSQKISSRGHFSLSSLFDNYYESSLKNISSSQSRTHFQWDLGKFSLASSYCTFGKILGLQFLINSYGIESDNDNGIDITNDSIQYANKIKFGGEVYYTAQEGSGGVSLGLRFTRTAKRHEFGKYPLIFTLAGNPLMGHYRSTITSSFLSPNISISSRYDVNINSFDSDLALGVAYRDPSSFNQNIKCALGLKNGFSFVIQTNITENVKIRFGLKTGPLSLKFSDNVLMNRAGSFGLDVAICN